MSNEVLVIAPSGNTMYFVRINSSGQVALSDGSAFEDWGTDGHDADDYDVALTEVGSGGCTYIGSFGSVAAGTYTVVAVFQAGANPADGDETYGEPAELVWNGSAEEIVSAARLDKASKLLVNKAVQDKATGAIEYYDDDGETVVLTHTPTDGESEITRTPS